MLRDLASISDCDPTLTTKCRIRVTLLSSPRRGTLRPSRASPGPQHHDVMAGGAGLIAAAVETRMCTPFLQLLRLLRRLAALFSTANV